MKSQYFMLIRHQTFPNMSNFDEMRSRSEMTMRNYLISKHSNNEKFTCIDENR